MGRVQLIQPPVQTNPRGENPHRARVSTKFGRDRCRGAHLCHGRSDSGLSVDHGVFAE